MMRGELFITREPNVRSAYLYAPPNSKTELWTWGVEVLPVDGRVRLSFTLGKYLEPHDVDWYAHLVANVLPDGLQWLDGLSLPVENLPDAVADNEYLFNWLCEQLDTLPPLQGQQPYVVADIASVGARPHDDPPPYATYRVRNRRRR